MTFNSWSFWIKFFGIKKSAKSLPLYHMALLTLPSILNNVCIYAVRISRMGNTKINYKAMITQYIEFVNF